MRSFEQRKEEIFRRSTQRIQARKKARTRILAACLPLCLLLIVGMTMLLPEEQNGNAESGSMAYRQVKITATGGLYSQREVSSTQLQEISLLADSLNAAFAASGMGSNDGYKENYSQGTTEPSGYRIIFTGFSGKQQIYILKGYLLTDETAGTTVSLNAQQRSRILSLLEPMLAGKECT